MTDPYSVLGVSSSSSDEEITMAYRKLAKKYHPDLNPENKESERKMREINAAYEQIKNGGASYEHAGSYGSQRQYNPYGGQNPYGDPFGGFEDIFSEFFGRGWEQRQGTGRIQAVRNCIINRRYQQAVFILSEISDRDAEWYYYSAIANAGTGNRVTALNHAREAVRMEPDNSEYQSVLRQLEQNSYTYRKSGQSYGFDMRTVGRTVMQLILAQMMCMFCCRPC